MDPSANEGLSFQPIARMEELDQALKSAAERPVLLYFGAEWCTSCKGMERSAFRDPGVREKLKKFRLLKVDITENSPDHQALLKKFSLFGPPAVLFFRQGQEIPPARMIGEQDAREFLRHLDLALRP
jgi:thiol:disulfide interchange protein DsbD